MTVLAQMMAAIQRSKVGGGRARRFASVLTEEWASNDESTWDESFCMRAFLMNINLSMVKGH